MVLAIDGSNIFFICYGAFLSNLKENKGEDYIVKKEDFGLFWHMYLRKVMPYLTTYKDCIFCFEGLHSSKWRKEIYPPYKENRADRKEDPNYKYIGDLINKTIDLMKLFHTKVLSVPYCEGDDCIYQTCKYYAEQGEHVKIISTDRDLSQIINYYPEYVVQSVPSMFGRPEHEIEAKENILLEKCIVGDTADNIKPFKGIGPKTFEKMLEDKAVWNKKMTTDKLEILEKVMQIVDLRKYPQEYQDSIMVEIKKDWNTFDKQSIEKFMLDNGLNQCYSDWSTWCSDIESLLSDKYEKEDAIDEIMDIING